MMLVGAFQVAICPAQGLDHNSRRAYSKLEDELGLGMGALGILGLGEQP